MIKELIYISLLFTSLGMFSQKDSIFNYLDKKGKITTDFSEAKYFETIVRQNDTLWMTKQYRESGKLKSYWFSNSSDNSKKIGQFVAYKKNDSVEGFQFYNKYGVLQGKAMRWFDNGNKNFEGNYINGKKEGAWLYYHYNGILATKAFFKNDSIMKAYYFDETGNKINTPKITSRKSFFDNGKRSFQEEVKRIFNNVNYQINGKFEISFIVNVDGTIHDVEFSVKIPSDLKRNLIKSFENLKGWNPPIHKGRFAPISITVPMNFK